MRQIERGTYFFSTTRPRPPVPPQKTTRPRRLCCARPKSAEKAQRSPRAGAAENANDGKALARHRDGTDQHPRCAPRPKPPRYRTGRTRDVEFIEGIDKCRGGDPDGLFASSLATSTTARARPESWVSGRASTVPSPASLSARRNPVVALSPRTGRLAHHLLDHAGR